MLIREQVEQLASAISTPMPMDLNALRKPFSCCLSAQPFATT
jgi:hypothetical protein